jgi:hypothetical protein
MLLDVLDELSGVLFEMVCIFDQCVASAGDVVVCHICERDNKPEKYSLQWGVYSMRYYWWRPVELLSK